MKNKKSIYLFIFGLTSLIIYSLFLVLIPKLIQICLDNIFLNHLFFFEMMYLLLFCIIFKFLSETIYIYLFEKISSILLLNLNKDIINKISTYDYLFFSKINIGDLIEYVENDGKNIYKFLSTVLPQIISEVIIVIGILGTIYMQIGFYSFLVFLVLLILISLLLFYYKKNDEKFIYSERNFSSKIFNTYTEWINNSKLINLLNLGKNVEKQFNEKDEEWLGLRKNSQKHLYSIWALSILLGVILSSVAILVAGIYFTNGKISIGGVYLIYTYSKMLLEPLSYIQSTIQSYKNFIASKRRLNELRTNKITYGNKLLTTNEFNLHIKELNYDYGDCPVLHNINMDIEFKDKLILFGNSGCGKSTFAKLISKLLIAPNNSIFTNDCDINDFDLDSFSNKVAYLSNEPFLINAKSIKDNLTLFTEVDYNDIHSFILKTKINILFGYPDINEFLNSIVDCKSMALGLQQLLNISHLYFLNKYMLILDESFSSVNNEWFSCLDNILEELSKNKTMIIITHNVDFLKNYSKANNTRIIKVVEGRFFETKAI